MKRVENAFIVKQIIIGTESWELPNSTMETHGWLFYIRGKDLNWIQKVQVTLHETFPDNVRNLQSPFELKEFGWGEFTIQIKIFLKDMNEKPIYLVHFLKLFDEKTQDKKSETNKLLNNENSTDEQKKICTHNIQTDPNNPDEKNKDPEKVISEREETIVFRSPSKSLYDILQPTQEEESDSETGRVEQAIEWIVNEMTD